MEEYKQITQTQNMIDTALYFTTPDIAMRAGRTEDRYVIKDGRYVLNEKDLERVRFTTQEYITGLEGIERVTKEEADEAIAENDYKLGGKV